MQTCFNDECAECIDPIAFDETPDVSFYATCLQSNALTEL